MPAGNPAAALFLVRRSSAGSSRIGPLQRVDGSPGAHRSSARRANGQSFGERTLCSFFRQAGLACRARLRFHDRPSMLLGHRAMLVVSRDARLLAFAHGVIYIENAAPIVTGGAAPEARRARDCVHEFARGARPSRSTLFPQAKPLRAGATIAATAAQDGSADAAAALRYQNRKPRCRQYARRSHFRAGFASRPARAVLAWRRLPRRRAGELPAFHLADRRGNAGERAGDRLSAGARASFPGGAR